MNTRLVSEKFELVRGNYDQNYTTSEIHTCVYVFKWQRQGLAVFVCFDKLGNPYLSTSDKTGFFDKEISVPKESVDLFLYSLAIQRALNFLTVISLPI